MLLKVSLSYSLSKYKQEDWELCLKSYCYLIINCDIEGFICGAAKHTSLSNKP